MDPDTIKELEYLGRQAWDAAERCRPDDGSNVEGLYLALRAHADDLNSVHEWMPPELFNTMLPTLEGQRLIGELDDLFGHTTMREPGYPVQRLLRHLGAWADGLRAAGQTFPDDGCV